MNRDVVRRFYLWLSIILVLGVFVVLTIYTKLKTGEGIICPINTELGFDCPACGGTRMIESLMKLEIYQAFRWNPFLFITIPMLLVVYSYQSYLFIFKNEIISWMDKFIVTYIVVFLLFGVIRNMEVLSWLKPTMV